MFVEHLDLFGICAQLRRKNRRKASTHNGLLDQKRLLRNRHSRQALQGQNKPISAQHQIERPICIMLKSLH